MATQQQPGTCAITIITPARNSAGTLDRTVGSLLAQSFADWEQIVCVADDDDETRVRAQQWAARDPRIHVVETSARTAGAARNHALRHAAGDHILFLDADDTIRQRHLETLLRTARSSGSDVVCGGYRRIDAAGKGFFVHRAPSNPLESLSSGPLSALHAMLFDRAKLRSVGGFDETLETNEDWDLCLRLARSNSSFAASPTITADYWAQPGSLTSRSGPMLRDRMTVARRHIATCDEADVGMDGLRTALWLGAAAIARGEAYDKLAREMTELPPAYADAELASDALLNGFMAGFACPARRVERRLSGSWQKLYDFAAQCARAIGDPGFENAMLRAFETAMARLGSAGVARMIGKSQFVPVRQWASLDGVLREEAEQVLTKLPLLRPRSAATFAFAPQVAREQGIAYAVGARLARRAAGQFAHSESEQAQRRDKIVRLAVLGRRVARKLTGRSRPHAEQTADSEIDAQELTSDNRWEEIFSQEDPWNYTNVYETRKYDRTLALLEGQQPARALELACAEGLFTARLADRVDYLTAADISATALTRAQERCDAAGLTNVAFEELDFFNRDFGEGWDLIVSSEVLYYMESAENVAKFAARVRDALNPNGLFLHAHAYEITDSPERTGFDWGDDFAAATICRSFAQTPGLALEKAVETDLYRIELYRKTHTPPASPRIEHYEVAADLDDDLASGVVWNGAIVSRLDADAHRATRVPVLMYHSIADEGPDAMRAWRVAPRAFEQQMRFLRRRGYQSVTVEQLDAAADRSAAIAGKPILITFDDGYRDFAETAWPLIKRSGFEAHVFIVADAVGTRARWDAYYGADIELMDWDTIASLAEEGVGFGSHLCAHRPLDRLTFAEAQMELQQSAERISKATGRPVTSLAPPYGVISPGFEDLAASTGYTRIFGVDGGIAPVCGARLRTPRIEVGGEMSLDDFAKAIGEEIPPDAADFIT